MNNLKIIRKLYGATQDEVALSIGVSRVTIAKWEGEFSSPTDAHLKKMAVFYGIDAPYFFEQPIDDETRRTLKENGQAAREERRRDGRKRRDIDDLAVLMAPVTFDDAMDVMEEEATEDMELMSGITPSEKTYLRSTSFDLFKNRVPWLMLMMVSATFTGLIITAFEGALAAQVALTAFIPMLMGTGGNSGSQSSVTVIRALSLNELTFRDIGTVVWKEIRTAVLCGLALAVVCFAKIWLVDRMLFGNYHITFMVDLVVCLALCVTVIIAKLVGCLLPLGAKALKLDPAVMASPFISTIVDALSLLVYFLFAKILLGV